MRKLYSLFFAVGILLAGSMLSAQQDELVPLEDLKPLEISDKVLNPLGFSYGLNLNQTFYHDTALNQFLLIGAYRPFAMLLINENHLVTARGKINYTHYEKKIASRKQDEVVGALELFNIDYNFGKNQRLKAGRAFYKMGRGLLFANFADGLEFSRVASWGQYKALALYSAEYGAGACAISIQGCGSSSNPFNVVPGQAADVTLPDAGKRLFYGFEYISPGMFWGGRLSALALYSQDLNTGTRANGEKYTFNPWYASLGARGILFTPALRYIVNYYYQGGSTFNQCRTSGGATCTNSAPGTSAETSISAHAAMADVNYTIPFFEQLVKPGVVAQYAFATGDADRVGGGTPAQASKSGNDTGFYYFGAFSGGLALKPRLHNMQVFRLGLNLRPLHFMYYFRNLAMSLKYSRYAKLEQAGPTSDPNVAIGTAATSSNLGSAIDLTLAWDYRSDVKFFYGFGTFSPGEAYKADKRSVTTVHLFSATINL